MEKLHELKSLKHDLISAAHSYVEQGLENVDTQELGEVVDMIKDLAEAEKNCIEYELMAEGIEGEGRSGYDRWRYASGRFAPKGKGSYGYENKMIPDEMMHGIERMGYTDDKSKDHEERMEAAMECVGDIWNTADTETKNKLKATMQDLIYQMEHA